MMSLHRLEGGKPEHHLSQEIGELAHLLFEWPIRQAPRLALPACILVAAIVQGVMIILFSISYTTPSEIQVDSPQIYLLTPDSAAARQLAPWLVANDPAVFSPLHDTRDAQPAPPTLKYRPSYEDPPPPLRPLPADSSIPITPPMLPPMSDIMRKNLDPSSMPGITPQTQNSASQPARVQTVVHWQEDLANRVRVTPSNGTPPLPQASAASVQPALYQVEISPEGLPLHRVLLDSSGDPSTDEAGSIWIQAQRFQSSPQSSWGSVRILWGAPEVTEMPTTNQP
jgi:hypothetical protein